MLTFTDIFEELQSEPENHCPTNHRYQDLKRSVAELVRASGFKDPEGQPVDFGPFGSLTLPYHRMGAIDSLDLFGIDELILFTYYWANRSRYKRSVDIGANIGLHSIVMSRCGFVVCAYEPDPKHFSVLQRNLALNGCETVEPIEAAVSNRSGRLEFVRVLGNTTSSHLAGAKSAPYGDLERLSVWAENIAEVSEKCNLMKIDAEGHEVDILLGVPHELFHRCDFMLEVGTPENAERIYRDLHPLKLPMFAQKTGWDRVESVSDVPTSHREGSLFISAREEMSWK